MSRFDKKVDCCEERLCLPSQQKISIKKAKIRIFPFAFLCLNLLTACQGTPIGQTIEGAIAPNAQALTTKTATLPPDFPETIPVYAQATLQDLQRSPQAETQQLITRWLTRDPATQVVSFYRDTFTKNSWRVLLSTAKADQGTFLAAKEGLLVTVSVQPEGDRTSILLQYVRDRQLNTINIDDPNISTANDTNANSANPDQTTSTAVIDQNKPPTPQFTGQFQDFATIPESLQPFIRDLNQLGVLSPKQNELFEPNTPITRREYVRWLMLANQRIYKNRPSRQIRPAPSSDTPTFADVPRTDPDFATIQGLANAGLITSLTNGTATGSPVKQFRPEAPLSREEMVLWKVPLDLRQPLPVANVNTVKQAWGFQDSNRIAASALGAVLADAQLGDLSNIRRSFGYTTVFQPQKPVTRAEAAAALWYFGTQTDGLSAESVLAIERSADSQQSLTNQSPQPTTTVSPSPTASPKPSPPNAPPSKP